MAGNTNLHNDKLNFIVCQLSDISDSYLHQHRRIRISSFTNNLKQIATSIKINLTHDAETTYNLLKVYASLKGLDINNLPALIEEYSKDVSQRCESDDFRLRRRSSGTNNFLIRVVDGINQTINEIDRHIETMRVSYGIENSNDARFNKTNPVDVYEETFEEHGHLKREWNHEKSEWVDRSIDWTVDGMKKNCKMLNSFKNDIINSFNKTFGDKSIFAPLNLSEILVK